MELSKLKQELTIAKEERNSLNITTESLKSELHETKAALNMNKESDIEAQVEIALLKSQFQEHRLAHKNGQVTEVSKVDHSKAEPEERNSENNNEWGTKSLLTERKVYSFRKENMHALEILKDGECLGAKPVNFSMEQNVKFSDEGELLKDSSRYR